MASPAVASDACRREDRLADPQPVCPAAAPEWASDWKKSLVSRDNLERQVETGWLPKKSSIPWLAPSMKEGVSRPLLWNLVVHEAFIF